MGSLNPAVQASFQVNDSFILLSFVNFLKSWLNELSSSSPEPNPIARPNSGFSTTLLHPELEVSSFLLSENHKLEQSVRVG